MNAAIHWTSADLALLARAPAGRIAPLPPGLPLARIPGLDLWDSWPLAHVDGTPVRWRDGELWFTLAAPPLPDPEARHFSARIQALHWSGGKLTDLGPVFAPGFTPGAAEWSGCALLESDGRVALYFTAAGTRGAPVPDYRQRLYVTRAALSEDTTAPFGQWSAPAELLRADGAIYQEPQGREGMPGAIKGLRDPFPWTDDAGGRWLLFTGSSAARPGKHDGVIGLARHAGGDRYAPVAPLVDASGLCNELERPHIVRHGGLLYLFWSSQAAVFASDIAVPTGLFGACAERLEGPWRLLNGHGLVFANPAREPFQAYSWWVLPDLTVAGFIDYHGLNDADAAAKPVGRAHFGGAMAPRQPIWLDGDRAGPAPTGE